MHRGYHPRDVDAAAILADADALVADVLAGAHAPVEVVELGPGALGIKHARRLADGLACRIAEHALRRRIPRQDGAVGRQPHDGVVRRRGDGCQPGVGVLGRLALGNVEGDAEHGVRAAVGPTADLAAAIDPAHLAVRPHDAELLLEEVAAAAHGGLVALAQRRPVVRVDEAQHLVRCAGELLRRAPEQPVHGVGPCHLVGGNIPLPHAEACRRQRQGKALVGATQLIGAAIARPGIVGLQGDVSLAHAHRRVAERELISRSTLQYPNSLRAAPPAALPLTLPRPAWHTQLSRG